MRQLGLFIVAFCLPLCVASAQRISRTYNDVSLSDALLQLQQEQAAYTINFLYNELEDFRVTTTISRRTVPEAIQQLIGFYPIIMTVNTDDHEIYVECTHKTDRHLTGCVVDELGQPIAYANVVLLNPADSTVLSGGVSNEGGVFVVPYEQPQVLARVSYVGYKTVYRLFSSEQADTIRMEPDSYTITGVVVKGERPQYRMTIGGMTVDVQNSLLSDVGTADDVLSMLPRVQGSDGAFTVFAKGTPEIYINNKKVQNARRELKQLKSSDIKSVDIITSPGAKYNAEVNAVIRIKTVRPQGEGVSVETYSQVKYNEKWTTYDDVTAKYRTGGLEVFGNVMVNNGNHSEDNRLTTDINAGGHHISVAQYAPNSFWYTALGGQVGASYDFNADNSVGLSYALNGSPYQGGTAHSPQTIWRDGVLEGEVDQLMDMRMDDTPEHEANVYYVGKAGKLGIDFNGSWLWKKSTRDYTSYEQSLQLGDRTVTTHSENRNTMLAGKLVMTYPVWKGELSVGMEATRSLSHGLYTNVEQVLSPSDDKIHERNIAGFTEYQLRLGEWTLSGGVRYEAVNSDYYAFGEHQAEPSRTYRDFFPNLSVGWQKNKWGFQLSYDKRIRRPPYYTLNSNVQYDNRYEYEGGNPLLRPTIKQNVDLSATYSWFNFTAGYTYSKDMWCHFGSLYQDGAEAIFWAPRNFDHHTSYNVSLTASPKFGFYQPTLTLSYWQQHFDALAYGTAVKLDKPQFTTNFCNWFVIGKTTKAMLTLYYATSYDDGFTHYASRFNADARLQKTFLDGNLTTALFANDIFRTRRERWTGHYPVTTMDKEAYTFTQTVGLSLSYTITATRSKYRGTGAGNDEKSRL